jgi:hypothetical protein
MFEPSDTFGKTGDQFHAISAGSVNQNAINAAPSVNKLQGGVPSDRVVLESRITFELVAGEQQPL